MRASISSDVAEVVRAHSCGWSAIHRVIHFDRSVIDPDVRATISPTHTDRGKRVSTCYLKSIVLPTSGTTSGALHLLEERI